jgi:hypothetical protein
MSQVAEKTRRVADVADKRGELVAGQRDEAAGIGEGER